MSREGDARITTGRVQCLRRYVEKEATVAVTMLYSDTYCSGLPLLYKIRAAGLGT